MADENRVVLHLDLDSLQAEKKLDELRKQDDKISVDILADTTSAQKAIDTLGRQESIISAKVDVDSSAADMVQAILNDMERSASSKAMAIAQTYRAQGMEMSDAMKKAWEQVGSSAQKTEPQLQKTSSLVQKIRDYVQELTVNFRTFGNNAKRSGEQASSGMEKANKTAGLLNTTVKSLAGAMAAAFSIRAISGFISASKEAWNVQLEAETKLETILGRNLHATKDQIQATKDWASALQKVGVIGDEVQLSGLQELSTYIGNADSLKTMNVVLNDMLAQQYGLHATAESAVTISTMLGKVLEGQTSALSRYGYSFTEAQEKLLKYGTEEQRVATLAEVVEASVGGMNESLANTPAGRLKQLENTMGDIKEHFGQAATNVQALFLPVLNKMAAVLDAIALKAIAISEYFGNLLGIDLSRNILTAGANTDALTESLEDAQKAAENLGAAGFDDFNVIGTPDVGTVETPSLDSAPLLTEAEKTASDVKDIFSGMFGDVDVARLTGSLDRLKEALAPFKERAWNNLQWVWNEILKPLGKWTIEDAAPAAIGLFSAVLGDLNEISEAFEPYGQWLWDEFLKPLGKWTGDIIVTGLENLTDWLKDVGDWIREHPDAAVYIGGLTGAFLGLNGALKTGVFTKIGTGLGTLGGMDVTTAAIAIGIAAWGYVITELSENWDDLTDVIEDSGGVFGFLMGWLEDSREAVEEFFSFGTFGETWYNLWSGAGEAVYTYTHGLPVYFKGIWSGIRAPFLKTGEWFGEKFTKANENTTKAFQNIGKWFGDRWSNVKGVFAKADSFFSEKFGASYDKVKKAFSPSNVRQFFEGVQSNIKSPFQNIASWFHEKFSDAWQRVLNVFSSGGVAFEGIKEGISGVFKETVNKLIDGINTVVKKPFDAINDAMRTLRDWSFMNVHPFEWVPSIDIPQIPRLARGGLVSQPTLAMVGDNPNARNDPEVVSPLSKLKEMLSETPKAEGFSDARFSRMIQLLEAILAAVEAIDPTFRIDGRDIYNANSRYERRTRKMKGETPC